MEMQHQETIETTPQLSPDRSPAVFPPFCATPPFPFPTHNGALPQSFSTAANLRFSHRQGGCRSGPNPTPGGKNTAVIDVTTPQRICSNSGARGTFASRVRRIWSGMSLIALGCSLTALLLASSEAAADSIIPSTWNIIGLDSNAPNLGPNRFPAGAKICSGSAVTNVQVNFNWEDSNETYIHLRANSLGTPGTPLIIPSIAAGACAEAYFEVEVDPTSASYDKHRGYYISVPSLSLSTPRPRELLVEHLISQYRNSITSLKIDGVNVAVGGAMNVVVGNTYQIDLIGGTAPSGYEQFTDFINFPNQIFQILSVNTTYSASDNPAIPQSPTKYPYLYADACNWDNDPNSPTYRSCIGTSYKAGGNVTTTYMVKIVSGGGQSATLATMLYDFSGASYHYNGDYSTSVRLAYITDPQNVTIKKSFSPATTVADGTSTLTFTLTNPNPSALSGMNFIDTFPTAPGQMKVAGPLTVVNGCGGTLNNNLDTALLAAGDLGLKLKGVTLAGNSSCTLKVDVTAPGPATGTWPYPNTTGHLFVNTTTDTCKADNSNSSTCKASATLTIDNSYVPAPNDPPTTCAAGDRITLATWTMDQSGVEASNPSPAPPLAAGVKSATSLYTLRGTSTQTVGNAFGDPGNSWGATGWYDKPASLPQNPPTTTAPYFDFVVDTTNYGGASISFNYLLMPNGDWGNPGDNMLYVHSKDDTNNFVNINGGGVASSKNTPWKGPVSANASVTGRSTTTFRINGTGAAKSTGMMYIDNITVSGCPRPKPPIITKAFAPTAVAVGDTSTLTFTITNPNTSSAYNLSGIKFIDVLPAGMKVDPTSPSPVTTCGGSPTWAPAANVTTLNFGQTTGATLAYNSSCTVSVKMLATAVGDLINTSDFVFATESGANTTSTGAAKATLSVLAPPVFAKEFGPNEIDEGTASTLTFTITNPNPNNPLTGVTFTDAFPNTPGIMKVSGTPGVTTSGCGAGVFSPVLVGNETSLNFTGATILAGATCTVTVKVTAPPSLTEYVNTATVSHNLNSKTWPGNTATAKLMVDAAAPLITLLKEVGTSPTGPWYYYLVTSVGTPLYYRFTVENDGNVALGSIGVSDPDLPGAASCTWPASLPVANATNTPTASCVVGPIAAQAGIHPNTATATGSGNSLTDTDTDTAKYATAELTLTKSATQPYFTAAGETIDYTYVVKNTGAAILKGPVTVTDDKVTVSCSPMSSTGDGDDYLDPNESINCVSVAPHHVVIPAEVTARKVTNTAWAATTATSTLPQIKSANVTKTVDLLIAPTVTKSFGSLSIPSGQSTTLTLVLGNPATNTASLTTVKVDDTFPAGLMLKNTIFSFTPDSCGTVTKISGAASVAGDDNVRFSAPSIAAGASCQVVMNVTSSTVGPITNTTNAPSAAGPLAVTGTASAADLTVSPLPSLMVIKYVQPLWDPVNLFASPKAIPGAVMKYTIEVRNSGLGSPDQDKIFVTDPVPANTVMCVSNSCSNPPIERTVCSGTPDCGLTVAFPADVTFSNHAGGVAPYDYSPIAPDTNGYDANITGVSINPKGTLRAASGGTDTVFSITFKVKIH